MSINIKAGVKSKEFWITLVTLFLPMFVPATPTEALVALITWVSARSAQKFFGLVDAENGKPSWKTSEMWVSIGYSVATTVFPGFPQESLYAVIAYVTGRTGIKITTNIKNGKNGASKIGFDEK